MSITDELRKYANRFKNSHDAWSGIGDDLTAIADRIDAEHERLMRERKGCIHYDQERHYCNVHDLTTDEHYQLLPKDADGECIHVGDVMERGETRGHVIALMLSEYPKKWGGGLHWGVQLEGEQAPTALDAFFHHYHAQTVEDVLREFANEVYADSDNEIRDRDFLCAKYAKRLTLAGGEDA